MKQKSKLKIYELDKSESQNKKYQEKNKEDMDLNNDIDNASRKLNNENDDITEFEENYYFYEKKINLTEKISFIIYISIGIILTIHSIHFILSEYVRQINILRLLFKII